MTIDGLEALLTDRGYTACLRATNAFGVVSESWRNADESRILAVYYGDNLNPRMVREVTASTTDPLGWAHTPVGEKWSSKDDAGEAALVELLDTHR